MKAHDRQEIQMDSGRRPGRGHGQMPPLKILLVYPEVPQTFWSLTHALKFSGKRAWSPPLGLLTVAAMLPKNFEQRLRDLNTEPLQEDDLE
jgi:hypothetical protein